MVWRYIPLAGIWQLGQAHMQISNRFFLISHYAAPKPQATLTREKKIEAVPAPEKTDNANDPQQQQKIEGLKRRDQEVKTHEQAHLAAAGGLAIGGANFNFIIGPDGKRYAIGGEVGIDVSEVAGDPQATIRKAEIIRRAALAPAHPSAQDYSIASKAAAMGAKAAMELVRSQQTGSAVVGSQVDTKA